MWRRAWTALAATLCLAALVPALRLAAHGTRAEDVADADARGEAAAAGGGLATLELPAPTLADWLEPAPNPTPPNTAKGYPAFVRATHHDATILAGRTLSAYGRGRARRGSWFPARLRAGRRGCKQGRWYEVLGAGFVCTARGFRALAKLPGPPERPTLPDLEQALPYSYAEVTADGAPRFSKLPTRWQLKRALATPPSRKVAKPLHDRMVGDYFVAIAEKVEARVGTFQRTVRGHYVREADLKPLTLSQMHGEVLEGRSLPLAFVFGDGPAPLFRRRQGRLLEAGHAHKHARMRVRREVEVQGVRYWVGESGLALPSARVRIARAASRPSDVPQGARWIHVDLDQQTLVAYEGDTPVFATLVSSGKPGHLTPTGLYQVLHKYVSTTMRGHDPVDGTYEVEEVPWTQFYDGSYALHGAYWHDDFGRVRSHGCTNLAPADARWLFFWTDPGLPPGWHGVRERGTFVYLTR